MTGRFGVRCYVCGTIVAYISEIVAKQAARSASMGFLPLDAVAKTAAESAALCCVTCEANRLAVDATTSTR